MTSLKSRSSFAVPRNVRYRKSHGYCGQVLTSAKNCGILDTVEPGEGVEAGRW